MARTPRRRFTPTRTTTQVQKRTPGDAPRPECVELCDDALCVECPELQALHEMVQQKVVTLLSDSENIVKQSLMENGITRLCVFFGRQKANDVLLSHMITFLNDKNDWHLRGAFFDSIVGERPLRKPHVMSHGVFVDVLVSAESLWWSKCRSAGCLDVIGQSQSDEFHFLLVLVWSVVIGPSQSGLSPV